MPLTLSHMAWVGGQCRPFSPILAHVYISKWVCVGGNRGGDVLAPITVGLIHCEIGQVVRFGKLLLTTVATPPLPIWLDVNKNPEP